MNASKFQTKIAVLWGAVGLAAVSSLALIFVVPGRIADMAAGMIEGEPLTDLFGWMFTALIGVALVMVAVSLLTGSLVARYVNVVVATLFGLFAGWGAISHMLEGQFTGHVVMAALGSLLAFLTAGLGVLWVRRHAHEADVIAEARIELVGT